MEDGDDERIDGAERLRRSRTALDAILEAIRTIFTAEVSYDHEPAEVSHSCTSASKSWCSNRSSILQTGLTIQQKYISLNPRLEVHLEDVVFDDEMELT